MPIVRNLMQSKFGAPIAHSWALSLLYSDIGLTPISDIVDIGLKGSQSDIGLTFLAISDIPYLRPDNSCGSYGS